ncbi:hypothetical protein D3C78_1812580 [compost metagenome]
MSCSPEPSLSVVSETAVMSVAWLVLLSMKVKESRSPVSIDWPEPTPKLLSLVFTVSATPLVVAVAWREKRLPVPRS